MLAVGTVLRQAYRIDGYLASGGFGNTYVATNVNFKEKVAIKEFFMKGVSKRDEDSTTISVSTPEGKATFEVQKDKFKKEALRLHMLNSKHIVRVHDLFEENGTAYYVMDYIDGESLSSRLKHTRAPMREAEVMDILRQVLDALSVVYSANPPILHLDIKPANIMIDKDGVVKLIDFGASKQISYDGSGTTSSAISYTNGYAPREQMEQNMSKFGPWTDFYALGATLYCLLSNSRPPLPSDIDEDKTPDKRETLPMPASVSQKMRKLVLWLMQGDRKERLQSVAEIEEYINGNTGKKKNATHGKANVSQKDEATVVAVSLGENANAEEKEGGKNEKPKIKIIGIVVGVAVAVFLLFAGINKCGSGSSSQVADSTAVSQTTAAKKAKEQVDETVTDFKYQTTVNTFLWTGTVRSGKPNGRGTATFCKKDTDQPDGRVYIGNMQDGLMVSQEANFTFANGDTYRGSFTNDHFDTGTIKLKSDGSYFTGKFDSQGQPSNGKWYDKAGNVIQIVR